MKMPIDPYKWKEIGLALNRQKPLLVTQEHLSRDLKKVSFWTSVVCSLAHHFCSRTKQVGFSGLVTTLSSFSITIQQCEILTVSELVK